MTIKMNYSTSNFVGFFKSDITKQMEDIEEVLLMEGKWCHLMVWAAVNLSVKFDHTASSILNQKSSENLYYLYKHLKSIKTEAAL